MLFVKVSIFFLRKAYGKISKMRKGVSVRLFVIIIYLLFITASFAASSADEEIVKIQKAYENIKDIKGKFIQKSNIKDLKRTDTYYGEFFIKPPMKMKWSYKGDVGQEVLINNDEIIIYQKKEKQAFKGRFNKDTYGTAPIALLGGFGTIQEEFNVSKKNDRLILKPRTAMNNILNIEIVPSQGEFPISSFTINDSHSNIITIELKDVQINTGLKNSLFEPSFQKNVTIYEQTP
jgi:outer membrane lipoprotein-sorting protein